ncbi:hypothetical protein BMR86_25825, partial [Stenotrophomonas sp. KAs 5-3]
DQIVEPASPTRFDPSSPGARKHGHQKAPHVFAAVEQQNAGDAGTAVEAGGIIDQIVEPASPTRFDPSSPGARKHGHQKAPHVFAA